ncbi:MAG TPA: YebC/PmpR family DNA-binding transcriptional regulator [Anaerolineales bacterium]|nr:YebC/PmpR family DNA-binding transcriptional regulator [Anaerolineales bacterium]
MSGHSKWSTIKRKKGANDAKRSAIFTQLAKAISIAAREGGGDPEMNISLRLAVDKAKAANMPKDNIERAIKRGTGEDKDAADLERIVYEAYASHGVALIIETVTDNRNRTVADMRRVLTRGGGSLGETGSVAWQFTQRAYFSLPANGRSEDEAYELAIEAGVEDVFYDGENIDLFGEATDFKQISDQLRAMGVKTDDAELRMFPNQEMDLSTEKTVQVMKVIEELEELDDVQKVDSNLAITDDALALLEAA